MSHQMLNATIPDSIYTLENLKYLQDQSFKKASNSS
jgi:hypothetical protein